MDTISINMNGDLYTGFLIANMNDLEAYRVMTDTTFRRSHHAISRRYDGHERFNSIGGDSRYGHLLKYVLMTRPEYVQNHLDLLSSMYNKKLSNMIRIIESCQKIIIIIDNIGSYCTLLHDDYDIVNTSIDNCNYKIKKSTKWINLENDPKLESYTIENLGSIDNKFSYILKSGSLSQIDIIDILNKFKSNGGTGIWQYTTGMYIDQLYMYINAGIKVGLTNFEINFNAGRNMDIDELINFYKMNNNINFNYNFVI